MATAPITGMAFYDEMTAVQEALKLANKTLAVSPTPRPDHSSSNGLPDMETVLRNLEENTQSHPRDVASLTQANPRSPASPIQPAQAPNPADPPQASPRTPASPTQPAQAPNPADPPQANPENLTCPTPASAFSTVQAAKPQEPANGLMAASLARLRKSNK